MKQRKRELGYCVDGKIIYPLLFQESDRFLQLIDDSEAGKIRMILRRA